MKALPLKLIDGKYVECPVGEATHVRLNFPGPVGKLELPIILKGKREGTGCWTWNGNTELPTVRPSVRTTNGHFTCHTWVNDGRVQFLDDCTHSLKGTTTDMLDIESPPAAPRSRDGEKELSSNQMNSANPIPVRRVGKEAGK